jgi:hypothetical protein
MLLIEYKVVIMMTIAIIIHSHLGEIKDKYKIYIQDCKKYVKLINFYLLISFRYQNFRKDCNCLITAEKHF